MLIDAIKNFLANTKDKAADISQALVLFEPEAPFRGRGGVTVLITAASLISVAVLGGVTLAGLLILLVCLSIIMLILTRVLGIDFDVSPEDIFGFRP